MAGKSRQKAAVSEVEHQDFDRIQGHSQGFPPPSRFSFPEPRCFCYHASQLDSTVLLQRVGRVKAMMRRTRTIWFFALPLPVLLLALWVGIFATESRADRSSFRFAVVADRRIISGSPFP
jgi:hypothetical protein